jgi:hypothetical protein
VHTSHIKFTELRFQGRREDPVSEYLLAFVRVAIDSTHKNAAVQSPKPEGTLAQGDTTKETTGGKTSFTGSLGGMMMFNHLQVPTGNVTIGSSGTIDRSSSREATKYSSCITQNDDEGVCWWKFNIDDDNEKKVKKFTKNMLPRVDFEFVADHGLPPLPKRSLIEVASFWSLSYQQGWWTLLNWIATKSRSWQHRNLCQVVLLEIPRFIWAKSRYKARETTGLGPSDHIEVSLKGSIPVTHAPVAIDDLSKFPWECSEYYILVFFCVLTEK